MRTTCFAFLIGPILVVAAAPGRADIVFRSRSDIPIGTSPSTFALLDRNGDRLVVATGDGLEILARHGREWLLSQRVSDARYVKSLAVGDLTGDGRPDIAYVSRDAMRVSVLSGVANGGFGDPVHFTVPSLPRGIRGIQIGGKGALGLVVAGDSGLSVLQPQARGGFRNIEIEASPRGADLDVADVTGDGLPDVILADGNQDELRILAASGDGGLHTAGVVSTVRSPRRVLAVDTDGDGHRELFVIGESGLALHFPLPEGRFGPPRVLWSGAHLADLAAADLDGDGRRDLVVTDRSRGVLVVFRGTRTGKFEQWSAYTVGRSPGPVLLADASADGVVDGFVLNELADSITILRGLGGGNFDSSLCVLSDADDLGAIAVADFNLDSRLDLAVTSEGTGSVLLFIGNGRGRFAARPPIPVGRQPRGLVAGRLDPDWAPDLAVVNFGGDEVAVLSGDGRGRFEAPTLIPVGLGPTVIIGGPFSGPDRLDLAVANTLSDSVSILYSDGRGRFPSIVNFPVVPHPTFLLVGDLDRDGRPDLVVGSENSESVSVLHGTGRALSPPNTNALGTVARPSLAEDLDQDGQLDLVTIDKAGDTIGVLPGIAPAEFGPAVSIPAGYHPTAVAAGDFDADGRTDLAVVHRETGIVTILLNHTPRRAPEQPIRQRS